MFYTQKYNTVTDSKKNNNYFITTCWVKLLTFVEACLFVIPVLAKCYLSCTRAYLQWRISSVSMHRIILKLLKVWDVKFPWESILNYQITQKNEYFRSKSISYDHYTFSMHCRSGKLIRTMSIMRGENWNIRGFRYHKKTVIDQTRHISPSVLNSAGFSL